MLVIFAVVLVVAAFCVMNTLITITVQKTREIGIMKAVGRGRVAGWCGVFLAQGVVVGAFGTLGRAGAGVGACWRCSTRSRIGWNGSSTSRWFSRKVYGLGAIPYLTKPQDDAWAICLGAFVLCSLGGAESQRISRRGSTR